MEFQLNLILVHWSVLNLLIIIIISLEARRKRTFGFSVFFFQTLDLFYGNGERFRETKERGRLVNKTSET